MSCFISLFMISKCTQACCENLSYFTFMLSPFAFSIFYPTEHIFLKTKNPFQCAISFSCLVHSIPFHSLIIGYDQFSTQVWKYCRCCTKRKRNKQKKKTQSNPGLTFSNTYIEGFDFSLSFKRVHWKIKFRNVSNSLAMSHKADRKQFIIFWVL